MRRAGPGQVPSAAAQAGPARTAPRPPGDKGRGRGDNGRRGAELPASPLPLRRAPAAPALPVPGPRIELLLSCTRPAPGGPPSPLPAAPPPATGSPAPAPPHAPVLPGPLRPVSVRRASGSSPDNKGGKRPPPPDPPSPAQGTGGEGGAGEGRRDGGTSGPRGKVCVVGGLTPRLKRRFQREADGERGRTLPSSTSFLCLTNISSHHGHFPARAAGRKAPAAFYPPSPPSPGRQGRKRDRGGHASRATANPPPPSPTTTTSLTGRGQRRKRSPPP